MAKPKIPPAPTTTTRGLNAAKKRVQTQRQPAPGAPRANPKPGPLDWGQDYLNRQQAAKKGNVVLFTGKNPAKIPGNLAFSSGSEAAKSSAIQAGEKFLATNPHISRDSLSAKRDDRTGDWSVHLDTPSGPKLIATFPARPPQTA